MFSKKKITEKNISITHESTKTIVIIDGKEVDISDLGSNSHLLDLLNNSHLDNDLISELLNSSSNTNKNTTLEQNSINTNAKVECSSCNKKVSYARGNCMYCGHKLKLPDSNLNNRTTNDVDSKYLNTDEIESNETNVETNYIDRLKDI